MNCSACGTPVGPGVNFCPRCGASITQAPTPAAPPPNWVAGRPQPIYTMPIGSGRVQSHLQTLGILWCVYAGYRILHGILGMVLLRSFLTGFGGWGDGWSNGFQGGFHPNWLAPLIPLIGIAAVTWALLAAFAGYALLTRKPWGRTLALVVAILSLIKIPVGTALGIYTLWALAPETSGAEYDALAARS